MSKVLIVYAPQTKIPIRWVIPDSEHELNDHRHYQPGESWIIVDVADPLNMHHNDVLTYIAQHHNIKPEDIPFRDYDIIHHSVGLSEVPKVTP
jgi:hypothetical protein